MADLRCEVARSMRLEYPPGVQEYEYWSRSSQPYRDFEAADTEIVPGTAFSHGGPIAALLNGPAGASLARLLIVTKRFSDQQLDVGDTQNYPGELRRMGRQMPLGITNYAHFHAIGAKPCPVNSKTPAIRYDDLGPETRLFSPMRSDGGGRIAHSIRSSGQKYCSIGAMEYSLYCGMSSF